MTMSILSHAALLPLPWVYLSLDVCGEAVTHISRCCVLACDAASFDQFDLNVHLSLLYCV